MQATKRLWVGSIALAGALSAGFYGMGQTLASGSFGERYRDAETEEHESGDFLEHRQIVLLHSTPNFAGYQEECGSCHMAYPARLLPPQSWQRIMAGLQDHFGENAELDETTRQQLEAYLVEVAQGTQYRRMGSPSVAPWPLRITELEGFKYKHNEIPARLIRDNDKIASMSQCNACHSGAERGNFDEDNVVIPGYGRWDD